MPEPLRRCTSCGRTDLAPIGDGKKTLVWEFVPAKFVRHEHVQEVLRCRCGGCVITAPGAPKVVEKGRYGASFLAHIAVAKCADHLPIYRLEKELARKGVPVARSTMNELLHRASALLAPVWTRLLDVTRLTGDVVEHPLEGQHLPLFHAGRVVLALDQYRVFDRAVLEAPVDIDLMLVERPGTWTSCSTFTVVTPCCVRMA